MEETTGVYEHGGSGMVTGFEPWVEREMSGIWEGDMNGGGLDLG